MRNEILTKEDKIMIEQTLNSTILNESTTRAIKNLKSSLRQANGLIEEKEEDIDALSLALLEILKTKIGEKIYWASKNWRMETHTITGVKYDIYNSDFFDTDEKIYKGEKLVIIEIDNAGTYIANNIGNNLFFDEEEAKKHARQDD